jgi:hypothetical protein
MGEVPDLRGFFLLLQAILACPPLLRLNVCSRGLGKALKSVEMRRAGLNPILGLLFALLRLCPHVSVSS